MDLEKQMMGTPEILLRSVLFFVALGLSFTLVKNPFYEFALFFISFGVTGASVPRPTYAATHGFARPTARVCLGAILFGLAVIVAAVLTH